MLDNDVFASPLEFLGHREWEWSLKDRATWFGVRRGLEWTPQRARRRLMNRAEGDYHATLVTAGAPAAVQEASRAQITAQQLVEVSAPADVGVIGVGAHTPYSVDSVTNPILAAWSGLAAAFGSHTGIAVRPARWRLDPVPPAARGVLSAAPSLVRGLLHRCADRHDRPRTDLGGLRGEVRQRLLVCPSLPHESGIPRRASDVPLVPDRSRRNDTAATSCGSGPTERALHGWVFALPPPLPTPSRSWHRQSAARPRSAICTPRRRSWLTSDEEAVGR